MRRVMALALVGLLATAGCSKGGSDDSGVWQWVDEKGSVQFAEDLGDVPEAYRARAGRIPMSRKSLARKPSIEPASASTVESPKKSRAPSAAAPTATYPVPAVTLYVSALTHNEAEVVSALESAGIQFQTIDVEQDGSAKEHLKELSHKQFPNA